MLAKLRGWLFPTIDKKLNDRFEKFKRASQLNYIISKLECETGIKNNSTPLSFISQIEKKGEEVSDLLEDYKALDRPFGESQRKSILIIEDIHFYPQSVIRDDYLFLLSDVTFIVTKEGKVFIGETEVFTEFDLIEKINQELHYPIG